ncbi:MAG: hypothetical protein KC684_06150, partial [Candidatus Omnitrophica bacterium]|nr:hypothetical protein [Candidatus Omnitrophota bacterium]
AIFSADQGVVDTDNKIIETAEAISQFSDYESTAITSGMFTNLGPNEKPIPNISELGVKMVDLSKQNYSVEKLLAQEYERVLNAMPTPSEYQTHLISLDNKRKLTHAALLDPAKTIVLPQGSEFITQHFNQYGNPDFVVGIDRSANQLGIGVRVRNQLVKFIPKNEFSLNNGWNAILPEELKSRIALDNNTVEQTTIDKILGDKKAKRQKVSFLGSDQKAEVVWSPYKVQWHAVGSERFFFDNEEIEIPLMHANQFSPRPGQKIFVDLHAHLGYDNETWQRDAILRALDQEIGKNNVLPLLTPADVDFFRGSLQRQNKASQRLYGKQLNSQKIVAGTLGFTSIEKGGPLKYVGGKYLYLPKVVTNEKVLATLVRRTDEALADIRSGNPKIKPVVKYFQLMNLLMDDHIPREIVDSPKNDYMMASAKSIRLREEKKLRDEIRVSILERNRLQGVGIPDPYLFKYLTDLNNDIELANGLNQESLEGTLDKLSSFNRESGEITRGEFTTSSSFKGLGNNIPIIQVGRMPVLLNSPLYSGIFGDDEISLQKRFDIMVRSTSPPAVDQQNVSISDFHPSIKENRDQAMLTANTYGVQRTAEMLPQVIAKVSTPTKTYQTDLGSVIKAQAVAISRFRSSMSQADYKDDKAMLIKLRNDIVPENLLQSVETGRFYRIDTPGMEDFVIYVIGETPKVAGYSLNEFRKKDIRGQAVAQLADNVFILDTSIQTESMKQATAKTMVVVWDSVPIERNLASAKGIATALDNYVLKHDLLQYNDKIVLQGQADEAMLIKLEDARTNGSGTIKDSRIYVARIVDGQQVINELIDGKVSDINVAIQNIERGLIITEELAPETVAYLKTLPRKSVLIATNALPRVADAISTEQVSNLLVLAKNMTVDISTLPSAKVIKATVQTRDNTAVPQLTPGATDVQPQGQTPMLPTMPIVPPVLQLGKKGKENDTSSSETDYIAQANLNRGPPHTSEVALTSSDRAMITDEDNTLPGKFQTLEQLASFIESIQGAGFGLRNSQKDVARVLVDGKIAVAKNKSGKSLGIILAALFFSDKSKHVTIITQNPTYTKLFITDTNPDKGYVKNFREMAAHPDIGREVVDVDDLVDAYDRDVDNENQIRILRELGRIFHDPKVIKVMSANTLGHLENKFSKDNPYQEARYVREGIDVIRGENSVRIFDEISARVGQNSTFNMTLASKESLDANANKILGDVEDLFEKMNFGIIRSGDSVYEHLHTGKAPLIEKVEDYEEFKKRDADGDYVYWTSGTSSAINFGKDEFLISNKVLEYYSDYDADLVSNVAAAIVSSFTAYGRSGTRPALGTLGEGGKIQEEMVSNANELAYMAALTLKYNGLNPDDRLNLSDIRISKGTHRETPAQHSYIGRGMKVGVTATDDNEELIYAKTGAKVEHVEEASEFYTQYAENKNNPGKNKIEIGVKENDSINQLVKFIRQARAGEGVEGYEPNGDNVRRRGVLIGYNNLDNFDNFVKALYDALKADGLEIDRIDQTTEAEDKDGRMGILKLTRTTGEEFRVVVALPHISKGANFQKDLDVVVTDAQTWPTSNKTQMANRNTRDPGDIGRKIFLYDIEDLDMRIEKIGRLIPLLKLSSSQKIKKFVVDYNRFIERSKEGYYTDAEELLVAKAKINSDFLEFVQKSESHKHTNSTTFRNFESTAPIQILSEQEWLTPEEYDIVKDIQRGEYDEKYVTSRSRSLDAPLSGEEWTVDAYLQAAEAAIKMWDDLLSRVGLRETTREHIKRLRAGVYQRIAKVQRDFGTIDPSYEGLNEAVEDINRSLEAELSVYEEDFEGMMRVAKSLSQEILPTRVVNSISQYTGVSSWTASNQTLDVSGKALAALEKDLIGLNLIEEERRYVLDRRNRFVEGDEDSPILTRRGAQFVNMLHAIRVAETIEPAVLENLYAMAFGMENMATDKDETAFELSKRLLNAGLRDYKTARQIGALVAIWRKEVGITGSSDYKENDNLLTSLRAIFDNTDEPHNLSLAVTRRLGVTKRDVLFKTLQAVIKNK